jgi:hypothetical protein
MHEQEYFKSFWNKIDIFNGFIYPVVGMRSICTSRNHRIVWSKKLGGWVGAFSWLPEIALKVYIPEKNIKRQKIYKQKTLDVILSHPEMKITYRKIGDFGSILVVTTKDGKYIGDVQTAAHFFHLTNIQPAGDYNVCNVGFDAGQQKWCGWSHRAAVCFGIGDKIFEEGYGDELTPFNIHGSKTIETLEEAKQSAIKFAEYIA